VTGVEVVLFALILGILGVLMRQVLSSRLSRRRARRRPPAPWLREAPLSPERAEERSLELLRSVINPEEWDMFTELGFICVTGKRGKRATRRGFSLPRYRYLIYPHLPLVALLPRSMAPVREYCVQFPDLTVDSQAPTLPKGDDVLAKWMTLRADEDRLLSFANVCNAGCQIPLSQIERDLKRLERWQLRRELALEPEPSGATG
jgi:hypothetical protein